MNTLPRLKLAHLPTPVEPMPRLAEALGGPRIMVKRDDQTGLALGGNKARKLEYLLGEAQAQGARTLITAGAVQSNHCRQTAAASVRFGFDCILVLAGEEPPINSGNLLLDRLFGAEIVWTHRDLRDECLQRTFEQAQAAGREPYLVPYGGSSPTGAVAYAFALQELMEQNVRPDYIIFASSSGGTQAGLMVGAHLFRFGGKVLGISVDERAKVLQERVAILAEEVAVRLGVKANFDPSEILVNDDYLGGGYGVIGEAEREAIRLFARKEGLLLDPVYTGRAAAGMIDLIRSSYLTKDHTVLFWHTGGTPALFTIDYQKNI